MVYLLILFLVVSLFLEGTVTAIPLVLVGLICLTIFNRNLFMFFLAFIIGIFLDIFAVRTVGETSIFFLFMVLLIFLYQRKYEINSYPFVLIGSFAGSLIYLVIFGYAHVLRQAFANTVVAFLLFAIIRTVYRATQETEVHFKKV
jgi:hypothetical protein